MNRGMLIVFALVASISFGMWQHSWLAGVFIFSALVVLDQRSTSGL